MKSRAHAVSVAPGPRGSAETLEARWLLSAPPDLRRLSPVLRPLADEAVTAPAVMTIPASRGPTPRSASGTAPQAAPGDGSAGVVTRDAAGRVGVTITARDVGPVARALARLGFAESSRSPADHLLAGYLPARSLAAAAGLGRVGLLGITPTSRPGTRAGKVLDEGDYVQFADRVRAALPAGYDGTGVKVGIISNSFDVLGGAAAGVASGDLPANVQVLYEGRRDGSDDEGRAMAEIVHDLAPGASIAFASSGDDIATYADRVRALSDAGCNVIVDDIFFTQQPFWQEDPVGRAIADVTARGVTYVTAAGNDADLAYESTQMNFVPAGPNGEMMYDFDPGPGVDTRLSVTEWGGVNHYLTLQWDDPFYTTSGVKTDLDLMVSQNGRWLFGGTSDNLASQLPYDWVRVENNTSPEAPITFDLEIRLKAGPAPGRLKLLSQFQTIDFNEFATHSPTITGHGASPDALTVAEVPWYDHGNFDPETALGPATRLFAPDGARLPQPQVLAKPDVAAVGSVHTTFFYYDDGAGDFYFPGTSAAAPHVAAIAALVKQAHPDLTPAQVRERIIAAADPSTGDPGFDDRTGAGLVDAYKAVFGPPAPGSLAVEDGFEVGGLGPAWEPHSDGAGRIVVTTQHGPAGGTHHLTLEGADGGPPSLNEVVLHVVPPPAGSGEMILSFRQREYGDTDDPMPATFTGSGDYDGVALSTDGQHWNRVVSLTGGDSSNTYRQQTFDLTAIGAAAGLAPGSDLRIKFQQFGDKNIDAGGGMAFDDVSVALDAAAPATPDLLPESDTGASAEDDLTAFDNNSPARALRFRVAGTLPGSAVVLYADGVAVGSAIASSDVTVVNTDGASRLSDGVRQFTATQRAAGGAESPPSAALPVTVDATAPAVSSVVFSGSAWARGFLDALRALSLGDGGLALAAAGGPAAPLPWSNIDRVGLLFTEPVSLAGADLSVTGPGPASAPAVGFTAGQPGNERSASGLWTLAAPLRNGLYSLALAATVTDAAGNIVAGAAGLPFGFDVTVRPGDVTLDGVVDATDVVAVRRHLLQPTTAAGDGDQAQSVFGDLDGSGRIDTRDLLAVRRAAAPTPPRTMLAALLDTTPAVAVSSHYSSQARRR